MTVSLPVIGMVLGSIVAQLAGIGLLPATKGFTAPLPSLLAGLSFVVGIGLLARLVHGGVPLGILIPLMSAAVPLCTVFVGILIHGEAASVAKICMLMLACGLVGMAARLA